MPLLHKVQWSNLIRIIDPLLVRDDFFSPCSKQLQATSTLKTERIVERGLHDFLLIVNRG